MSVAFRENGNILDNVMKEMADEVVASRPERSNIERT